MDLSTKKTVLDQLGKLIYPDINSILNILIGDGPNDYGFILRKTYSDLIGKPKKIEKNGVK